METHTHTIRMRQRGVEGRGDAPAMARREPCRRGPRSPLVRRGRRGATLSVDVARSAAVTGHSRTRFPIPGFGRLVARRSQLARAMSPLLAILSVTGWMSPSAVHTFGASPKSLSTNILAPRMAASSSTVSAPHAASGHEKKSVLVLGWFFAKERELEYVRRMYEKNGFDEVVVQPSEVGVISKPRGWYRLMRRRLQPDRLGPERGPLPNESLSREFTVVHCLSGGFLALYVLLRSGIDLRFATLLCDSTPILPKPSAFARFVRAYIRSVGLALPPFAESVLTWLVAWRWRAGILYIRMRHMLLRALGRPQGEALSAWQEGPVQWGLAGDYDRVARHALGTVFAACARHDGFRSLELLYNPEDPFLDMDGVREAASEAQACGLNVRETQVKADHIKACFSSPKTVFGVLDESGPCAKADLIASTQTPDHERIARLVVQGEA